MSVQLWLGPAASGKTERCVERILSMRRQAPLQPIWVVLPNRAQVVSFRRRFANKGGGFGVRVETIDAFIEEITIRLGCQRPRASGPVRRRIVQTALGAVAADGELTHFAPIAGSAGLSHLLSERFLEVKQAGWERHQLKEKLHPQGPALQEFSLVFDRYQQQLNQLGWEDEEGLAKLAAQELPAQPAALADLALIVVDGFDSFTSNQLDLFKVMANIGCELIITLPQNATEPDRVFPSYKQSLAMIRGALTELEFVPTAAGPLANRAIQFISQNLTASTEAADFEPAGSIEWLKAHSINAEVREALRWLKRVVVRQKIPLQSCALVLTDPEGYEATVREVAHEFGIPLRFGLGQQLHKSPGIAALLDLLRLEPSGWGRRSTLDTVRSPFFDLDQFGLAPADAASLEAVSYWGQVVEGIEQWSQALAMLATRANERTGNDEEARGAVLPTRAEAERLQLGLEGLAERMDAGASRPLSGWVMWLEDLLQDLEFFDRFVTKQEQAAGLRLRELLRALLLSEQVIDRGDQSYLEFLTELEGVIERARFQPKPEWRRAALQVEGLEAVRGLRFRAVALVGLSEGQLPAVEREDPLLDEDTRETLRLEPRIGQDQLSLFYSAITRADDLLLLTRPTMAEDGEQWQPSPFWQASLRPFGKEDDDVPLSRRGDARPLAAAGSPQEFTFLAVRRGSLPSQFSSLEPRLEPLRRVRGLIEARLAEEPTGPYEGELSSLAPKLRQLHDADHLWSPSRLESYGTCPHYYLTSTLLKLELLEEPSLGPDPRQLGSLLHQLLELAYQQAADPADPDQVVAELRQLAEEMFEKAPQQYGFRPSPLWHIEADLLTDNLENSVRELAKQAEGWLPFAYEATFGLGADPALRIDTDQGEVLVRGVVDRLDRRGEEIRVIDYKTGGSHLGRMDLLSGRRLQLPIYALAAERSLRAGQVKAGFYWNIRSAKAGSLKLESFNATWRQDYLEGVAGAYRVLRDHLADILLGVRSGEFQPEPPQGGCPSYCPAANWCWRYEPGYRP